MDLPYDIFDHIIRVGYESHILSSRDLSQLTQVNKFFHNLINDNCKRVTLIFVRIYGCCVGKVGYTIDTAIDLLVMKSDPYPIRQVYLSNIEGTDLCFYYFSDYDEYCNYEIPDLDLEFDEVEQEYQLPPELQVKDLNDRHPEFDKKLNEVLERLDYDTDSDSSDSGCYFEHLDVDLQLRHRWRGTGKSRDSLGKNWKVWSRWRSKGEKIKKQKEYEKKWEYLIENPYIYDDIKYNNSFILLDTSKMTTCQAINFTQNEIEKIYERIVC